MASERDPRIDPRPGDVLRKARPQRPEIIANRTVLAVDAGHVYFEDEQWIGRFVNRRTHWLRWAKDAEVIQRGDERGANG